MGAGSLRDSLRVSSRGKSTPRSLHRIVCQNLWYMSRLTPKGQTSFHTWTHSVPLLEVWRNRKISLRFSFIFPNPSYSNLCQPVELPNHYMFTTDGQHFLRVFQIGMTRSARVLVIIIYLTNYCPPTLTFPLSSYRSYKTCSDK